MRGHTSKPCEGCGRKSNRESVHEAESYGWERKQGENCSDCQAELETGRGAVAELAKIQGRDGDTLWRWVSMHYAWPSYRTERGHCGSDQTADALHRAMWELAGEFTRPAPADAPRDSKRFVMRERTHFDPPGARGRKIRDYLPWPRLVGTDESWSGRDMGWGCLVLCRPSVRDRLFALDEAIRAGLDAAWDNGKSLGGSVLMSLASGALSLDDFDETLKRRDR